MARGIWIHVVVLMLKHAYLSPSERVYHTWRAALHLEISIIIKIPVHALPCSFAQTVHVNINLKKKGKTSKDLGEMCVHTYWLSDIFTFSHLSFSDCIFSKTSHVIFIIHLKRPQVSCCVLSLDTLWPSLMFTSSVCHNHTLAANLEQRHPLPQLPTHTYTQTLAHKHTANLFFQRLHW